MPVELVDLEVATPFDRLLLILVGREKTGKSRLAATGRKGVLFFDFDGRYASVAGIKGCKAVTVRDPGLGTQMPTAFNDAVTKLSLLEASRKFSGLGFKGVPAEQDDIRTVVVDSVFSMAKCAARFAQYTTQDLSRTLNIGGMTVRMPNGWDSWNAEIGLVEQFINRLLAIKGMDIILIFHEDDEEAPGSSAEKRTYTGRYEIYPNRYSNALKYFNECWRLTRTAAGAPQIQVQPNFQFQAATNLGIQNVEPAKANISDLIETYLKSNPNLPKAEAGVISQVSTESRITPIKGVV